MLGPTKNVLRISNNGIISFSDVHAEGSMPMFAFVVPKSVHTIDPVFGTSMGGTIVHVSGTNFIHHGEAYCLFDMKRVSISFINSTMVSCVTPTVRNLRSDTSDFNERSSSRE